MLKVSAGILLVALALGLAHAEEFRNIEEAKQAAFANEEKKLWKQIKWRTDAEKAVAEATKAKKPIMVFLLVNEWGKLDADQCWVGARATRGRALSHPKVIQLLNKDFIPLEVNLTQQKDFPACLPALWPWKIYHSVNPISKLGFVACVTLTPDGKAEIDNAGNASATLWKTAAYYHGDKFVEYLERSTKRFKERAK